MPTGKNGGPLGGRFLSATANYIDERTSLSGFVKELGRKIFPDHWSFMLGEIALWSFVVVLLSGTFLTFFFQASMVPTHYTGAYLPMRGVEMSAALDSTLRLSFDIRGGLLVRQIHHWAALVFVAGIGVHMLRVFFTGAFRKPRELNWVIGFILFVLAMAEGFTGYSLPDDLLSGNGLRIIDGILKGMPLIGTWASFLFFGGEFPGNQIVGSSLHAAHPAAAGDPRRSAGAAPDADGDQQAHAVRGPRPLEQQRRGLPDDADLHVEDGRLPLHHVRRDRADRIAVHDQPDLELRTLRPVAGLGGHAARLVHRLRRRRAATRAAGLGGCTSSATRCRSTSSSRGAVFSLLLVAVAIYPFIEAWVTGDKREHHYAQRPRNSATRTAIGAAGVTMYAVLWAAAASDIIATHFWVTMEGVIHTLQALLFIGPILAYFVAKRMCLALQKKDREIALHGYESGRIVRLPGGEYIEVHQPVDDYDRYKLVDIEHYEPLIVRPNAKGRIPWHENLRAAVSRWFFEDRLTTVTQTELDEARAHQHHELDHIAEEEHAEIQGAHERAGVPDAPHVPIDDGRQLRGRRSARRT